MRVCLEKGAVVAGGPHWPQHTDHQNKQNKESDSIQFFFISTKKTDRQNSNNRIEMIRRLPHTPCCRGGGRGGVVGEGGRCLDVHTDTRYKK